MNSKSIKKQEQYFATQLSSEDYQNFSEVVREALRMHELYRNKVLTNYVLRSLRDGTALQVSAAWRTS
ncbi:hypothetical protein [uncultured Sunxiuqinia sp.]|uniref:hypothetical protein n=1 Tax=uncultured Sunxiuqinia sp. TaxID=1573825 RepID=UPI0030DA568E